MNIVTVLRRAAGVTAVVVLAAAAALPARGDFAYAYAEQTLTGLRVSAGAVGGLSVTSSSSTANAVMNGAGIATSNPTDTLSAFTGPPPGASQNAFVKIASAGGGTQAGDFSHGDSVMTNLALFGATGTNLSAVAESFIDTAGNPTGGSTASNGAAALSATFTLTGTTMSLSYNYSNDILAQTGGLGGPANASFQMTINVSDQHGHSVNVHPLELTGTSAAPPVGPEVITSGSGVANLNLAALTAGDLFTMTINEFTSTFAVLPAPVTGGGGATTPLPAGAWAGLMGMVACGMVARRERRFDAA